MHNFSSMLLGISHSYRHLLTQYSCRSSPYYFLYRCLSSDKIDDKTNSKVVSETAEKVKIKPISQLGVQTNPPIIKNLMRGRIEPEILEYPELETKEELEELEMLYHSVHKFFKESVDSDKIDRAGKIDDALLQAVKDLGLYGQQIPREYGGLGLNSTQYARLAEATGLDGSIQVTLAAHQSIGLKGILIAGNNEQKQKYLPKLATGEHVAAFCLTEPQSGSDAQSIQMKATVSDDGSTYILNGSKIWITNGGHADIMTVFARTNIIPDENPMITAFIVERNFGGITSGKPEDKLGIRGSNTCEVHFDNVPVPVENILGEVGSGFKIAMQILNSGRFTMGASGAGILRDLLSDVTEHVMTRKQFGRPIGEFDLIKEKLARIAVDAYVMESMVYFVSGLLDRYKRPDLSLEAAAIKIFSSESINRAVHEILQIMGGQGFMRDYPYERYTRDARILPIFEGTNEILRLFIAGTALQSAGRELTDLVRKLRAPLHDPFEFYRTLRQESGKSRKLRRSLNLVFEANLHPNLLDAYSQLTDHLVRLEAVVKSLLSRYGKDIAEEQMLLKRFADLSIDILATIATLSRLSRSICIGIPGHDHELDLGYAFFNDTLPRIDRNLKELEKDKLQADPFYKRVAERLYKNKGYIAKHPLFRTW